MQHLPSPVSYREDINGLRAYAVLVVLLFHFEIPLFESGFIGVDMFFVISGFLMTAIILKGIEKGDFSIFNFYMARARRILPALMTVITILLFLGWFYLPTTEYKNLGVQSVYSLSFLSNFLFWKTAGYFDTAAHEKFLLHTWSLAVEAQFYILFPLFLMIIWKVTNSVNTIFWSLVFIFIISLSISLLSSSSDPVASFYLFPQRVWELAAGGMIFLYGRINNIYFRESKVQYLIRPIYLTGWFLLLIGLLLISSDYAWPSGWALLPVLGTAFIILANQPKSFMTANPIMQWLGDRSYSLYLWHWPIFVTLYFIGKQNLIIYQVIAVVLSLVLAHISYRLIEIPTRKYLTQQSTQKEFYVILIISFSIIMFAYFISKVKIDGRLPLSVEIAAKESTNIIDRREECHTTAYGEKGSPGCVFGGKQVGALLVGDSHAVSTINPIRIILSKNGKGVKLWSFSACPTIKNVIRSKNRKGFEADRCIKSTQWILDEIKKIDKDVPAIIVNSSRYFYPIRKIYFEEKDESDFFIKYLDNYIETMCEISKDRKTYILRPYPIMPASVPQKLSRNILLGIEDKDIKISLKEYRRQSKMIWDAQDMAVKKCNLEILDPLPYLCEESFCYGSRDYRPLYYDDTHLSEYGNQALIPMFKEVLENN